MILIILTTIVYVFGFVVGWVARGILIAQKAKTANRTFYIVDGDMSLKEMEENGSFVLNDEGHAVWCPDKNEIFKVIK